MSLSSISLCKMFVIGNAIIKDQIKTPWTIPPCTPPWWDCRWLGTQRTVDECYQRLLTCSTTCYKWNAIRKCGIFSISTGQKDFWSMHTGVFPVETSRTTFYVPATSCDMTNPHHSFAGNAVQHMCHRIWSLNNFHRSNVRPKWWRATLSERLQKHTFKSLETDINPSMA